MTELKELFIITFKHYSVYIILNISIIKYHTYKYLK